MRLWCSALNSQFVAGEERGQRRRVFLRDMFFRTATVSTRCKLARHGILPIDRGSAAQFLFNVPRGTLALNWGNPLATAAIDVILSEDLSTVINEPNDCAGSAHSVTLGDRIVR
jgi:hypothetical protein